MKVYRNTMIVSLLVGIAGLGLVFAQERPERRGPRTREEARQIRETMLALMSLQMKQHLELTEDQERDILPLLEELQNARAEARFGMKEDMDEMRRMLDDPGTPDRDIEAALERMHDSRRKLEDLQRELREKIDRHLTIRQQAKMLFFQARFRRRMEDRIRGLERMERQRYRESRRQYEEALDPADPDEPF